MGLQVDAGVAGFLEHGNVFNQVKEPIKARPLLVFIYLYFVRLGLLDGKPGFTYCRLRAWYEYLIDLKVREFERRERGLPV